MMAIVTIRGFFILEFVEIAGVEIPLVAVDAGQVFLIEPLQTGEHDMAAMDLVPPAALYLLCLKAMWVSELNDGAVVIGGDAGSGSQQVVIFCAAVVISCRERYRL